MHGLRACADPARLMSKRKAGDDGGGWRRVLATPNVSERATLALLDRLGADVCESTFKRKVKQNNAGAQFVYRDEFLPAAYGDPVRICVADIHALFQYAAAGSAPFEGLLRQAMSQGNELSLLLYHDDVQGGNILAPLPSKKITLCYVSVAEFGPRVLKSPRSWLVCGAIENALSVKLRGGLGAYIAVQVRQLLQATQQPFALSGHSVSLRIGGYVSDYDAQRITFACKGSAGLVCCLLCANVLRRDSKLVHSPADFFVEITESRLERFHQPTDQEIFDACDLLLRDSATMSRSALEKQEKAMGICLLPDTILFRPELRAAMPPSLVLNDCMHSYFCNGVCSWETGQILEAAATKSGVCLSDLEVFVERHQWLKPQAEQGQTPAWRKRLFAAKKFSGDGYKGQAHELRAVVPLLQYFLHVTGASEQLQPEMRSFDCLAQICRELDRLTSDRDWPLDALDALQPEHQRLCIEAYGASFVRPKHHHRLHIPAQARRLRFFCGAESMEAKHRDFKQSLCDRLQAFAHGANGGMARPTLARMLLMHVDDMNEHDAFHLGLHRPVHDCPDLAPYVPELARAGAKLRAAKMATMPHITACKNDVLMELDAACAFLVETCFTADAELLFLVKELRLDAWTARIVFLLSLTRCGVAARFRSLHGFCVRRGRVRHTCVRLQESTAHGDLASWWTLVSSQLRVARPAQLRRARHPKWWLWESSDRVLCLQ